mgnify:CR=1 FL=1
MWLDCRALGLDNDALRRQLLQLADLGFLDQDNCRAAVDLLLRSRLDQQDHVPRGRSKGGIFMLTPMQTIAAIAVMALVTFLTRALPFLLFDRSDHTP